MRYTINDYKPDSETLWLRFKETFFCNIKEMKFIKFEKSFSNEDSRTEFYKIQLLPKISKKLKLNYSSNYKEFLRVDYTFYRIIQVEDEGKTQQWSYPIVFIESENNIESLNDGSDTEELYKLCCLNAPLKLIFTYIEGEFNGDRINKYLKQWQFSIDVFVHASTLIGYLGIIVVAKKEAGKYIFHRFLWDTAGKLIEREQEIKETVN